MADRIAYNPDGTPYIVDDSPISIPPELKQVVIASLKAQGVTDLEIPERLEGIEAEMMILEMKREMHRKGIDDQVTVLNLTQSVEGPEERGDPRKGLKDHHVRYRGMHIISPQTLRHQAEADRQFFERVYGFAGNTGIYGDGKAASA